MTTPPFKITQLLLAIVILSVPVALANSYGEEDESEGLELSLISGLILFVSLLCTIIVVFLMKKRKGVDEKPSYAGFYHSDSGLVSRDLQFAGALNFV